MEKLFVKKEIKYTGAELCPHFIYKNFKIQCFSWRGFWSKRDNFFNNISSFKFKLINHYTKNFMKPILEPIIDISYYLPEFSGFDPKNLFLPDKDDKIYKR